MRDLRSPVFLHIDGGGILINLIVWLGERKTRRAVTGKTSKTGIARKTRWAGTVCCSKNIR